MKFRFGDCEIDTGQHRLLVNGAIREVEPQVFDLLRHMAENPGRLVAHDELIETIWQGRIVSDSAISARISAARSAVGDDGSRQAIIKTVPKRGFRFVADVDVLDETDEATGADTDTTSRTRPGARQRVRFCTSQDRARIAYAKSGEGYPLVRTGHWLTHLEHDWESPIWHPFLSRVGRDFQITRYDQRGNGLSDWSADAFSLDRFVEDLEAVVDAAGLDRFALYGTSQGAPISIAYAVRHPERVTHLILHGGFAIGRLLRDTEEEREQAEALLTLIRHSWGKADSAFIKSFASLFIPDSTSVQLESLADLQRRTTSAENAARLRASIDDLDVRELLHRVAVPTLVIHARKDAIQPLEEGRRLASTIPDAEFVTLESKNHVILDHEPAWEALFEAIRGFVLDRPSP